MSVPLLTNTPTPYGERIRLTREMCAFLERACITPERYELIDGEMVSKHGQGYEHSYTCVQVVAFLLGLFSTDLVRLHLAVEVNPQDRETNWPVPDMIVLTEQVNRMPENTDVLLAVEVCGTGEERDYGVKHYLYARAGIPEYWILDINRRVLMAYRQPNTETGVWAESVEYTESDAVTPFAAPDKTIPISELLP